jgi:autotransporter-associated beta strand protein
LNWNSVDGVWQNQTNWLEQTAPTNDISTNNAIFSQNIGDQISKLSSDTSITGINFSHPNSTLIISNNSSPKSLTVGGLGLRTTTGASSSTTMGSSINPLLLNVARAQTWSNLSNNPFRIFGFVTNSSSNNITLSIGSIDVFGSIYENNSGGTLNLRYFTNNISSTNYRSIPSNNTYNGNTTITNGRYFLDNNNIFGSGSGILEIRLATLLANNDIVIPNPALLPTSHLINNFITFSGDYSYTFENSFTINNSNIRVKNLIPNNKSLSILGSFIRGPIGTIISISSPIFDGSGNMNISGNMINNHANIETLNWNSSGVLTLSGSNTNSRWNIRGNSGIVVIQNSNSYWTAGANIVNNGCTMVLGFPISQNFINAIGSASTGDIALTSSSSVSLTWNSSASLGAYGPDPITYSGSIIPQNGFYRLGGGGGTLIVDGISFTGNNGLVLGGASSGLGGTVILNNTTISNTGEIVISKNTEVETSSCFADSSSAIAMNRDSKLIYNGSGCTTDRTINLTGQSPLIIYSPETTVEANGTCFPMTISSIINSGVGDTTLILSGASTIDNILSGAITGPSTSVVKTGSGLWRLSGLSSYGGQLRVLDGTLVVATSVDASAQNANGPFGSSGLPIIGSSEAGITGTASLLVAVGQSINRGFSVAPLGSGSSQVVVIGSTDIGTTGFGTTVFGGGHRIGLGRDVTLQASRNGIALFSSIWTEEPYNGQIDNRSPAVAITIGSNGNDGIVLLESMLPESITKLDIMYGTLQYQSIIYGDLPDRIGILTPVTINSSVFDINGQSQTLANLSFAGSSARVLNGTLVLNNVVNVVGVGHEIGSAVTLSNNVTLSGSGELLISGIVSGTHNIIKNGSGLLKLSGANTYSGTTIINGGIIKAESSTAFGSGTITVNSGGTLDRNGYSISNNIVNNGGTVL